MPVSKKPRKRSKHTARAARSSLGLGVVAIAVVVFLAGAAGFSFVQRLLDSDGGTHVEVRIPELSRVAQQGERLFSASCAGCHGANAAGSDAGPPLVHRIYEPNHHGDGAFYRAVRQGVRAHHWPYGDMSPVPAVDDEAVGRIVQYIRELQKANGIF